MRKRSKILCAWLALGVSFTSTIRAEPSQVADGDSPGSGAGQIMVLIKPVDAAYGKYSNSADSTNSDKLWDAFYQLNTNTIPKVLAAARQQPESAEAFAGLTWIVTNPSIRSVRLWTNADQSLELLAKYHAAESNLALGRICARVAYYDEWRWTSPGLTNFAIALLEKNPDRTVRGQAMFALARITKSQAEMLADFENTPGQKSTNEWACAELEKKTDSKTVTAQAAMLFNKVIEQYGDCANLRQSGIKKSHLTLAEEARPELFELQHLSIGCAAPEMSGDDLNGKEFKLGDYRGKVVVLSFWASWCGPCMQLVPVERRLTEQFAGKPFAMVGVNGDAMKNDALRAVKNENMSWRSFWNGKDGPNGGIAEAWNVHGWPTIYILDAKGVIRSKFSGYGRDTEKVLNETVERLLKEE